MEKYGPLDTFSAFSFKSFLGQLEKIIRKPNQPLPQIVRRVAENAKLALLTQTKVQKSEPKHKHNFGPLPLAYRSYSQFYSVHFDNMYFSLKDSDNCVKIGQDVCLIRNIICDKSEEVKVVPYILAYPALDYPAPRLTGRVQQADTFYIIM